MQHSGGKGSGTSPPTLLQQLQLQHQQQAAQRQQDRQHTSQLFSHALSSSQLLSSSAGSSPPSSYQSHQFAAPISAASANVFRSPPPAQLGGDKYGLISAHTSGTSLLSSAPSGPASSSFSSQSPFSAPPTPLSSLYSSFMHSPAQSKPTSEASSFPSSGTSTPTLASQANHHNLHSLLYPQGLSSASPLSALSSLQLSQANQLAPYLQLAGAGLLNRNPRMSLNDSLSALNYLSNNSSPFSSFPGTPTAAAVSAAMPMALNAQTARFTKAIALEQEPYDGLVGMKGNVVGRVKRACGNCKAAKTKCDSERPCRRCSRTGRSSSCNDSVHKKRGRKKFSGGGEGGEEGDGGESGDEGDEEEGGHSPHSHNHHDGAHTHHHMDKKAKKGAEQAETEQLKIFLLDCALKFRKHLERWQVVHQQQSQSSPVLTNALRWFALISQADSLRKLLYTGKDGIKEDAHTTDMDLLVDGPDVEAALEAAQREIEGSSDVPGYVLPLYPIPYCLSPATFLSPKTEDRTHPPPRVAYFNDAFCQLLSSSPEQLTAKFAHLPSFLAHCAHPHLDSTIGALVDAVCSGRPSVTVQSKYADSTGHTYEAIESVSIHSVRGVPIALAISLHSIVSHDGGRVAGGELIDDPEVAKLLDDDSDDEGIDSTTLSTPAGGTTTGPDSDASPIAHALGRVVLMSPSSSTSSASHSLPSAADAALATVTAADSAGEVKTEQMATI